MEEQQQCTRSGSGNRGNNEREEVGFCAAFWQIAREREKEKHDNIDLKPTAPRVGWDRSPTRGEKQEEPKRDESRSGGGGGTQIEIDYKVSRAFKNCCARSRTVNVSGLLAEGEVSTLPSMEQVLLFATWMTTLA